MRMQILERILSLAAAIAAIISATIMCMQMLNASQLIPAEVIDACINTL